MARPTKLTPEVQQRLVTAIRVGNYAEPAARSAGISPATYHRWMKRGEHESKGIYRDFYEAVSRAEADAEVEALALVRKKMPEDPRLCLQYLERRYPARWRRRETHELTGEGGGPMKLDAESIFDDPEARRLILETLRHAGRARAGKPRGPGADH